MSSEHFVPFVVESKQWGVYIDPTTGVMFTEHTPSKLKLIILDEKVKGWFEPDYEQSVSHYDEPRRRFFLREQTDLPLKPFPDWFTESRFYENLLEKLNKE